jgi:hypothetical protein
MYLLTQPVLLDAVLGFIAVHYSDVQCTAASSSSSAAAAGSAFSPGPVEEIREWMQLCCSGSSSSSSSSSSTDAAFYSGLEDHLRSRGYRVPLSTKKADAAGQSAASAADAGAAAASAADLPSFNQHAAVGKARVMWSELSQVTHRPHCGCCVFACLLCDVV